MDDRAARSEESFERQIERSVALPGGRSGYRDVNDKEIDPAITWKVDMAAVKAIIGFVVRTGSIAAGIVFEDE
ncbi:MAG: hypothetical protein LQ340_004279 [Diploschistes diacapsis]|nr:MAG: hypothetical protein LQ340_004279 [Diploschistes diacapsis]